MDVRHFEEFVIHKYHASVKESVKKQIEKFNFKIKFFERTWVLKECGGGFGGHYNVKATLIDPVEFGVLDVKKDKKKQCSDILVWTDGCADGYRCSLINVPNGLFKQIHENI